MLYGKLSETWKWYYDRSILRLNRSDIGKANVKDFTIHLLLMYKHARETTFGLSNSYGYIVTSSKNNSDPVGRGIEFRSNLGRTIHPVLLLSRKIH